MNFCSCGCVCGESFSRFSSLFSITGEDYFEDDWRYFCGYVSCCFGELDCVRGLRDKLFDEVLNVDKYGWRQREVDYLRGLYSFRSDDGIGSLSFDSSCGTFSVRGYRKTVKSRRWRLMVIGIILLLYPCSMIGSDGSREQYSMRVYGLHEKCSEKYGKLLSCVYSRLLQIEAE